MVLTSMVLLLDATNTWFVGPDHDKEVLAIKPHLIVFIDNFDMR